MLKSAGHLESTSYPTYRINHISNKWHVEIIMDGILIRCSVEFYQLSLELCYLLAQKSEWFICVENIFYTLVSPITGSASGRAAILSSLT